MSSILESKAVKWVMVSTSVVLLCFSACKISPNDPESYSPSEAWILLESEKNAKVNQVENGDAEAAFDLSLHYQSTGDKKKELEWLKRSSYMGYATAQYNLAYFYEVEAAHKNIKLAKYWYGKAYENGNKQAKENLIKLER